MMMYSNIVLLIILSLYSCDCGLFDCCNFRPKKLIDLDLLNELETDSINSVKNEGIYHTTLINSVKSGHKVGAFILHDQIIYIPDTYDCYISSELTYSNESGNPFLIKLDHSGGVFSCSGSKYFYNDRSKWISINSDFFNFVMDRLKCGTKIGKGIIKAYHNYIRDTIKNEINREREERRHRKNQFILIRMWKWFKDLFKCNKYSVYNSLYDVIQDEDDLSSIILDGYSSDEDS